MTKTIKLIAIDVDGTLLNNEHQLTERTEKALRAALEKDIRVILATGKTRRSVEALLAQLNLTDPGIYVQGLTTYAGDGALLTQQVLSPVIVRQVLTFAEDRGFTVALYSGARILARKRNPQIDALTIPFHEPPAEEVGPLQNVLSAVAVNKVVALGDARRVKSLRWQLSMQLNGTVRLMQAGVPEMVEVLPPGGSKGAALKTLLNELSIPAENVLAIGDAENDIELLKLAGIGVAMGNASPVVKAAADYVTASNDEDGAAQAIERFVLADEQTEAVENNVTNPVATTSPESGEA